MPTTIVEIPFSKRPYLLLMLGALVLLIVGLLFILDPSLDSPELSTQLITTLGIIFLVASVAIVILMLKQISSLQPAIKISEDGIYDHSYTSFGFISWDELESVKRKRMKQNRYLLLFVKNPEIILSQKSTPIRRSVQRLQRNFETPIFLTNHRLDCSFDELQGMIERRFNLYRKRKS